MRPVALDRKNWIHIGSPQADPQVAAILSVAENCRRLKLPVRDYLTAVLPDSPILGSSASQSYSQCVAHPASMDPCDRCVERG